MDSGSDYHVKLFYVLLCFWPFCLPSLYLSFALFQIVQVPSDWWPRCEWFCRYWNALMSCTVFCDCFECCLLIFYFFIVVYVIVSVWLYLCDDCVSRGVVEWGDMFCRDVCLWRANACLLGWMHVDCEWMQVDCERMKVDCERMQVASEWKTVDWEWSNVVLKNAQ